MAIIRGNRVITPTPEEPLESGDELLFVALPEAESAIRSAVIARLPHAASEITEESRVGLLDRRQALVGRDRASPQSRRNAVHGAAL